MSFLNPLVLLASLGVALPIIAHLLNRYQVKRTDWAAMQFLDRSVRVRSRQIRLRDLFLLLLRCLAIILLALGLARPFAPNPGGRAAQLGERRAGVVIAIDASFSMGHGEGGATRYARALEHASAIGGGLHPGDPVSVVLLGAEHRVVARGRAFEPGQFAALLDGHAQPSAEPLDLETVPAVIAGLAAELDAPRTEVYLITDLQARDWERREGWLDAALADLGNSVQTTLVAVGGGGDNLAITDLELVSGVLRKDSVARYRATVENFGSAPASDVRVTGFADGIAVDSKVVPLIPAGASETVSLFVRFPGPGAVQISAEIEGDGLEADNERRAVAVVRDEVSVLSVHGDAAAGGEAAGFVAAALRARGGGGDEASFAVRTLPWIDLPGIDLERFDVVVLQGVPEITPEQAAAFESYVRAGHGLIWFAGDEVDAEAWNRRGAGGVALLPAVIESEASTSDALGVGRPLDPLLPDHPVCRPLRSLPEDLLSEARFRKVLQVAPAATASTVLSLAGTGAPLLIEHGIGRGQVCMFTSTADPAWNSMALTPVFPMVMQQLTTYLTSREFETPRLVGDSLALSYPDRPDASEAVFDTPSDGTISVPVREHRNQHVALLEHAGEAGFYLARVSLQAPGVPVAVNVDTAESDVASADPAEVAASLADSGITVVSSEGELLEIMARSRESRALWFPLLLGALGLLVVEGLVARRALRRRAARGAGEGATSADQTRTDPAAPRQAA